MIFCSNCIALVIYLGTRFDLIMKYDRTVLSYFWHKIFHVPFQGSSLWYQQSQLLRGCQRRSDYHNPYHSRRLLEPAVPIGLTKRYVQIHVDLVIVRLANNGAVQSEMRRQPVLGAAFRYQGS